MATLAAQSLDTPGSRRRSQFALRTLVGVSAPAAAACGAIRPGLHVLVWVAAICVTSLSIASLVRRRSKGSSGKHVRWLALVVTCCYLYIASSGPAAVLRDS